MFFRMRLCFLALVVLAGVPGRAQDSALVGRPCLFNEYFPEWRCFPAILRDAAGNLSCGRNRLNHGGVTGAPLAAGPVAATALRLPGAGGPQYHFAYRDLDGGIQDLWYVRSEEKDRWFAQSLNLTGATQAPAAAGDPSGFLERDAYHVVYRDRQGGIHDLALGEGWRAELLNLDGGTGAPPAAGDPAQLSIQGRRHVVYRDRDGRLQDLWFDQGWRVRTLNLGGLTQGPPAGGEPAGLDLGGVYHVVYRDTGGQVQDVRFAEGGGQVQQLTGGACTQAPPAAGEVVTAVLGGARIPHVVYRDRTGGLQDLFYDGAWQALTLNAGGLTDAPPAASDPFLLIPPSNWLYVGYVDRQGSGRLLTRDCRQNRWAAGPLNAQTPPGSAQGGGCASLGGRR